MKNPLVSNEQLEGLIEDSLSHLHAALFLMEGPSAFEVGEPEAFNSTVGFLLHLSTELLLKAVIYERTGSFPKNSQSHNLNYLTNELKHFMGFSDALVSLISEVSNYHQLRYHKTDKRAEHSTIKCEEIEDLWTLILNNEDKIRKIATSKNFHAKYGISFTIFKPENHLYFGLQKNPDKTYTSFMEELPVDAPCPLCSETEAHSH